MSKREFRSNTAIIIPVYNEQEVIRGVIQSVLEEFDNVICVNDGSKDYSAEEIGRTKAILVNHPINMGQGAALQTGLEYARSMPNIDYFVNFDADGQHDLGDVKRMLAELAKGDVDIVLGSRFLSDESVKEVPIKKRVILRLAVWFTRWSTGLKLTDAHNGLRVFNRHAAEAIEITMPDMAHASEILTLVHQKKLRYTELPVTIHYTDYSKAKGQSVFNAINILYDIMVKGRR